MGSLHGDSALSVHCSAGLFPRDPIGLFQHNVTPMLVNVTRLARSYFTWLTRSNVTPLAQPNLT